jgi:hypothetical protein
MLVAQVDEALTDGLQDEAELNELAERIHDVAVSGKPDGKTVR